MPTESPMVGRAQEIVVDTMLWNSRVDTNLSKDVLKVLLERKVLDPNRLVTLAENPGTHEYARNFFIEALGCFDAPRFSDLFSRMLAEKDEHVRLNAAERCELEFRK